MAVPLGRREERADLVDLLLECHARIRSFLDLASLAATRPDLSPGDVVDACSRVERYFTQALPLHVRDEEESILPRLRGHAPEVDRALESMHAQHAEHAGQLAALLTASAALRQAPTDPARRGALGEAAAALTRDMVAHLSVEERVIFPALRSAVPAAAQAEIVNELRARRR